MLDPSAAAGEHDRGVGRSGIDRRRLAQGEREQQETDRIGEDQQGRGAGDHMASRKAARTAVRATQVAKAVSTNGSSARMKRSTSVRLAPPVSSPAKLAPNASSSRTSAAAPAPARLPTSAS